MAEQSGERRLELSGEKVSLWSLIFEKIEKDYLANKKEREDKMKKILMLLLVLPLICFGEPNGYFRYNRSNDTFDVIADNALLDTVSVDTIQMDLTFSDGMAEGRLQWDAGDGTLEYGLPGGDVTLQVGFEMLMRVTNKSGADIGNGVPVYVSGAQGSRPTIALADADDAAKHHVIGVTTEDIANNATGYVTAFGYVRDMDTSAWTAGDELYLSTTAGELTTSIPPYPAEVAHVGTVLFSNPASGIIAVNPHMETSYANTAFTLSGTNITADATNVGRMRYYTTASNSFVDVSMQTGTNSYSWINIQSYGW